ncbi:hypothetical protein [Shinella sp.]
MTCIADPVQAGALQFRKPGLWHKLSIALRPGARKRRPRLDPRELSDHIKRDLGFLDGRSGR